MLAKTAALEIFGSSCAEHFFFFAQEPHLGSNNSVLVKTRAAEAAPSMTPHRDLLHFPLITAPFAVINALISKNVVGYGSVMAWGLLALVATQLGAPKAWQLQVLTAKSCFTWHEGKDNLGLQLPDVLLG